MDNNRARRAFILMSVILFALTMGVLKWQLNRIASQIQLDRTLIFAVKERDTPQVLVLCGIGHGRTVYYVVD